MKKKEENLTDEETITDDEKNNTFSFSSIILIAGWIGLLTGLAEGIFLVGWRHSFRSSPIFLSSDVLWMAPITEMVIFVVLGAILAFLHRQFPRFIKLGIVFFVLVLVSFMALFMLLPQFHIYTKWILSAGLAFQIARLGVKYRGGFYQFVRSTSVWLVAVVFSIAVGMIVWNYATERAAISKLPTASKNAPNVLLITMDTVRAESLSLYGYERQTTPQLEKLAKESVVFEQAIAPSSWTLPSHAGIFTGKTPNELSFSWREPLETSQLTIAEALGQRGYESAGFAANLLYCTKDIGISKGMLHYEDYPISIGQMFISASLGRVISSSDFVRKLIGYEDSLNRKNAETINRSFLKWLSSRKQDRPFFAFLNYFDAHEPILPPAPFDERFGSAKIDDDFYYQPNGIDIKYEDKHDWSEQEKLKYQTAYDNSIAYLDQKLGELFAKLSEKNLLDNTIVIVTSDHGESLGERGLYGHGNTLYPETIHVPLLIRFPSRLPKDTKVGQLVSLLDLPATVLDLIGEESKTSFSGSSLKRFLDKESGESNYTEKNTMVFSELRGAFVPPWYPSSKGIMQSLTTDLYHYIRNGDGSEELYNRKTDPKELTNISQAADVQVVLEEFRKELKNYSLP